MGVGEVSILVGGKLSLVPCSVGGGLSLGGVAAGSGSRGGGCSATSEEGDCTTGEVIERRR